MGMYFARMLASASKPVVQPISVSAPNASADHAHTPLRRGQDELESDGRIEGIN
jgi:hypothetical protein